MLDENGVLADPQKFPVTVDGNIDSEQDSPAEINNPNICPNLSESQKVDLENFLNGFSDVLSDIPWCTSTVEHDIVVSTTEIIKAKYYPIPVHLQHHFVKS